MPWAISKPGSGFEPLYTSTLDKVGVSADRPVQVGSWMAGDGEFRRLAPGQPEYPGWHYGYPVYVPDLQDRRPHSHDHFEISVIRQGKALHRTCYATDELGPGTVIVLAPGMTHAIYGIAGLHQTNIYYLTEWLADDLMAHWRETGLVPMFLAAALFRQPKDGPAVSFSLSESELTALDRELADITRECVVSQPSLTFLRSSLLKALILLSRSYTRQSPVEVGLGFREEIVAALEHIEESILRCEPFNVGQLAGGLGVCPDHLGAIFRKATGWSPMTYYQRRRVQHACNHLLDLNRSLTEIAHALGFCDSAHFTNMFKKHQGTTPIMYRHRYTSGQRNPHS
ncbi:MAG TPA: AraC family transcriptional regulator [Candidatus Hydrogenedentes bacterium]|nr:AraC family transcriptional regulator [Candidatus Hydrogenedentota bacterium]HQH52784.1 AraC family transcriptional regulator [Candidatus Hydrogenedentota bacterium]HQM49117.1 AraC family transcriptional regulator [Candidatus Hydrogenedentota bacterium]